MQKVSFFLVVHACNKVRNDWQYGASQSCDHSMYGVCCNGPFCWSLCLRYFDLLWDA